MKRSRLALAVIIVVGCRGTEPTSNVVFHNYLLVPVAISSGGRVFGSVPAGATQTLTISSGLQTVDVGLGELKLLDGSPIHNDVAEMTLAVSDTVAITRTAAGSSYFMPRVTNASGASYSIGIINESDSSLITCYGNFPTGQTLTFGLYRSTTYLTVFQDANCSGFGAAWFSEFITTLADVNSGLVQLSITGPIFH